jgi:hypothetical protein
MDVRSVVHDIAQMNTHPKVQDALRQALLHGHGASHGILNAGELSEKTITGKFHQAAAMAGEHRLDHIVARRLPSGDRAYSVLLYQPRVTGYVSRKNGG